MSDRKEDRERIIDRLDSLIADLVGLREDLMRYDKVSLSQSEGDLSEFLAHTLDRNPADEPEHISESSHLDMLFAPIDESIADFSDAPLNLHPANSEPVIDEVQEPVAPMVLKLVDRLTLLDKFYYANELFSGNQGELLSVLEDLERMSSRSQAEDYLVHRVGIDIESEAGASLWTFVLQCAEGTPFR